MPTPGDDPTVRRVATELAREPVGLRRLGVVAKGAAARVAGHKKGESVDGDCGG